MKALTFFIFLIPYQALAKAPECPGYSTRQECLGAVDETYDKWLDFIRYEDNEDELLLVAQDVKYYEGLACKKTCLNEATAR